MIWFVRHDARRFYSVVLVVQQSRIMSSGHCAFSDLPPWHPITLWNTLRAYKMLLVQEPKPNDRRAQCNNSIREGHRNEFSRLLLRRVPVEWPPRLCDIKLAYLRR